MKNIVRTFGEFVNESYKVNENFTETIDGIKITWNSKKRSLTVGRKTVDPDYIDYERFGSELIPNASDVKSLNDKERSALEDFISGAYNSDIEWYYDEIFGGRPGW